MSLTNSGALANSAKSASPALELISQRLIALNDQLLSINCGVSSFLDRAAGVQAAKQNSANPQAVPNGALENIFSQIDHINHTASSLQDHVNQLGNIC